MYLSRLYIHVGVGVFVHGCLCVFVYVDFGDPLNENICANIIS